MSELILTPQQHIALEALGTGASVNQAAAAAGIHRNTIANWRRESVDFRIALANAQYDRALLFREKAEEMTDLAFDTLRGIFSDAAASPSVRLKAALAIVNLVTHQMPPKKDVPVTLVDSIFAPLPKITPTPQPASQSAPQHDLHNSAQNAQPGTIRRDLPKVGRNEPCPCGSGLKHKRCCDGKVLAAA